MYGAKRKSLSSNAAGSESMANPGAFPSSPEISASPYVLSLPVCYHPVLFRVLFPAGIVVQFV